MRRLVAIFSAAALMVVLVAAPATAVVDEIVGAWCSGQSIQPPGISDESNMATLARPLFASKVLSVEHFDLHAHVDENPHGHNVPHEVENPGPHGVFDFARPNVKIQSTGEIVNVGTGEEPFYIDGFELKSAFPAFQNCPNLLS